MLKNSSEQLQFETLELDDDYEIAKDHYPYIIRRISNHQVLKESTMKNGYKYVCLNCKAVYVHRIVALQWINNDDPERKTQVDHINHDRSDNRLENLRWITQIDNLYAGIKFEQLEELSDLAFELTHYNNQEFKNLWFDPDNDCFYYYTGTRYREEHYYEYDSGELYIQTFDVQHVLTNISLYKFKKYFELI